MVFSSSSTLARSIESAKRKNGQINDGQSCKRIKAASLIFENVNKRACVKLFLSKNFMEEIYVIFEKNYEYSMINNLTINK